MVRQRTLTPSFQGSNPCGPAIKHHIFIWCFFILSDSGIKSPCFTFTLANQISAFDTRIRSYEKRFVQRCGLAYENQEVFMYSFKSNIRFSEVDNHLYATLPSILTYFQDCSIFHSEFIERGVEYCKQQGFAWLLSSWQIIVERYPKLGEEVTVSTWAYGFKGFFGYRNFSMKDKAGNMIAYANTNWIFTDIKTGHPTRITQDMIDAYSYEPQLEMQVAPRKIAIPAGGTAKEAISVHKFDIDSNEHVNNERYVLMAQEFLPEGFQTYQLRAEYKRAAVYGDTIYPVVSEEEGKITVVLNDENSSPYAVIVFETA